MPNRKHPDHEDLILYVAEDAVIAHSITPFASGNVRDVAKGTIDALEAAMAA